MVTLIQTYFFSISLTEANKFISQQTLLPV